MGFCRDHEWHPPPPTPYSYEMHTHRMDYPQLLHPCPYISKDPLMVALVWLRYGCDVLDPEPGAGHISSWAS